MLDRIITGNTELDSVISAIDKFLISENQVMNFDLENSNNIVRTQEIAFHNLISSLENNGVSGASELTVFELYQRIEYYEDLHKKMSKKTA